MIKLELTVDETNAIINSLAELPYKLSNDLIQKIVQQARPQAQAMQQSSAQEEAA